MKTLQERIYSEELENIGNMLYYSKLPHFEKYYIQAMVDGTLQYGNYRYVYYGRALNATNVTQIIEPFLDQSFKGKWRIELILPKETVIYGELEKGKILYSWENLVPLPGGDIGKIIISIGG